MLLLVAVFVTIWESMEPFGWWARALGPAGLRWEGAMLIASGRGSFKSFVFVTLLSAGGVMVRGMGLWVGAEAEGLTLFCGVRLVTAGSMGRMMFSDATEE
jgi:hypothetical protein